MPLMQLAEIADYFPGVLEMPGRLAESTIREYRFEAQHYLAWCGYSAQRVHDPGLLRSWIQHMAEHTELSPATITRRLRAIQSLMKYSAECEAIDAGLAYRFSLIRPMSLSALRLRLKPQPEPISTEEMRVLFRQPDPTTLIGLRDRAMLMCMASSGCRLSELVGIDKEDVVNLDSGYFVRILGKGQSRHREAQISGEAYYWIDLWLKARASQGIDVQAVFTAFKNDKHQPLAKRMSKQTARYRVQIYGRQIGLDITPHDLRRFCGTQVAERHGLRQAQKQLGHKRLETTAQHYVFDKMKSGLVEQLF